MSSAPDSVVLLWHIHELNGVDDELLIGVYRTEEDAKAAILRLAQKPGFVDTPQGFEYERYELGRDHWVDGYVKV